MDPLLEKNNGMYVVTDTPFGPKNIKERYDGIIGPLSIFAPFAHEDEGLFDDIEPSRPVTPINDEIKKTTNSLEHLLNLIKRRITPQDDVSVVSKEDQKSMAAVLVGEVGCLWPSVRKLVDNPFLTLEENMELRRRTIIYLVTTCESLFKLHLKKAEVLQKRHVFTDPANMSRIRAQLALDAVNTLHLPSIRRKVLEKMRKDKIDAQLSRGSTVIPAGQAPKDAVNQILSAMPDLDIDTIIGSIPTHLLSVPKHESTKSSKPKTKRDEKDETSKSDTADAVEKDIKRSVSMPNLALHDSLGYELDLEPPRPLSPVLIFKTFDEDENEESKKDVKIDPKKDLEELVEARKTKKRVPDEDDDLPPILQALPPARRKKVIPDSFDEWLHEKPLQESKSEDDKVKEQKSEPSNPVPQPSTVTSNFTKKKGKVNVRASDIRISERNCITSLPIDKYTTVYNDLMDEIDPVTVKNLDKNIFVGDEIKEVYAEIMRTVPTDHLDLENDRMIKPCADTVRIDAILSASSISRRIENGTINEALHKAENPPWGNETCAKWANIPVNISNNNKNHRSKKEDAPEFPDKMLTMEEFLVEISEMPKPIQEKMTRSYQSYLAWWKNNITVDDYMKYLVRQETDFIGYMHHFYNDKKEDDEIEHNGKTTKYKKAQQAVRSSEMDSKVEEARAAKVEYTPGSWNAQAVLLGGLGKDPGAEELGVNEFPDDKEDEITPRSKKSSLTVVKRSTLKTPSGESLMTARSKGKLSVDQQSTARLSKTVSHVTQSKYASQDPLGRPVSSSTIILTHQDRLEKIWTLLRVPDATKMDMAIKYSSYENIDRLDEFLDVWEEAVERVLERESLITKLENFERVASDPNRYFEKGFRGSSIARFEEGKQRAIIMKKIKQVNSKVEEVIKNVSDTCLDTVSFQGRPYKDKMKWDILEMQHWLEEERKQAVLENHALSHGQYRQLRTVIAMT